MFESAVEISDGDTVRMFAKFQKDLDYQINLEFPTAFDNLFAVWNCIVAVNQTPFGSERYFTFPD
jgi:hypothetical protein